MDDPRREARATSPEQLDREAEITERDLADDVLFWDEHGSPLTQAMLDARSKEEET